MKIIECEQGTPEWYAARVGKITASEFKRIVTNTLVDGEYKMSKSMSGYAAKLAAEMFAGKPMDQFDGNTVWMERGKEIEEEAAEFYAFTTDADVRKVGFIIDDDGVCGCSPDRLVEPDGGLEIKCLRAENHVELTQYHAKHGCAEPKYTQQVQACLWITGRAWWDQLFYSPELPPLVIRQVPDLVQHASFVKAVAATVTARDACLASLHQQQTHIPERATA